MSFSRRGFLKWAGAANMAVLMGKSAAGASNQEFKGYPDSQGVLYDSTLCIGCRKCEKGCNTVNELSPPEKPFDDLSVLEQKRRTTNDSFTVVNRYAEADKPAYRKIQCNHCQEPACASVCFVRAFQKSPSGAVTYDATVCVGCRYCMIACPFEIPTYEYDKGLEFHPDKTPRVRKCTMCQPRILEGLLPGCVESCPNEALLFGKRTDLLKTARERIAGKPGEYIDHIYGEKEMGGTNWLYLSGTSFGQIGLNEHLGTKPAIEYTAGTLSAVPLVVGLWPVFLAGSYAMNKRREKVALSEQETAVAASIEETQAAATEKLDAALKKADRMKRKEVENAVKKALAEAQQPEDDKTEKNNEESK